MKKKQRKSLADFKNQSLKANAKGKVKGGNIIIPDIITWWILNHLFKIKNKNHEKEAKKILSGFQKPKLES